MEPTSHISLNIQELDVDMYCFSAHKMYGPTGVGVLYGKEDVLNEIPPYQGGGEMIKEVSFKKQPTLVYPINLKKLLILRVLLLLSLQLSLSLV